MRPQVMRTIAFPNIVVPGFILADLRSFILQRMQAYGRVQSVNKHLLT